MAGTQVDDEGEQVGRNRWDAMLGSTQNTTTMTFTPATENITWRSPSTTPQSIPSMRYGSPAAFLLAAFFVKLFIIDPICWRAL